MNTLSEVNQNFLDSLRLTNGTRQGNKLDYVTDRLLYIERKKFQSARLSNKTCYGVSYKMAKKLESLIRCHCENTNQTYL